MGWVKEKGGHYCDRCGASIWLNFRQERFIGKHGEGGTAGDPYVSVNRNAFFEDGKRYLSSFMYCYDCEPLLFEVLKKFNAEMNSANTTEEKTGEGPERPTGGVKETP